jgi:hypothetical protein
LIQGFEKRGLLLQAKDSAEHAWHRKYERESLAKDSLRENYNQQLASNKHYLQKKDRQLMLARAVAVLAVATKWYYIFKTTKLI